MHQDVSRTRHPMPANVCDPSTRGHWIRSLAAGMVVALILLATGLSCGHRAGSHGEGASQLSAANPPEDARLTYAGPFKNIHPEVPYAGDAECAQCHKPESESFRQHPMGR